MVNLQRKIKVINRTDGALGYKSDVFRVKRYWRRPGDYINIPLEELLELKSSRGTAYMLEHCFKIDDAEARVLLYDERPLAPEYDYSDAEIEFLLYTGTNEQLLDALDYAPDGVLALIRTKACEKMPDTMTKIEAINKKFKVNIATIHANTMKAREDEAPVEEAAKERRTSPISVPAASAAKKQNVKKSEAKA